LLDGGWQGWCELGYPVSTAAAVPAPGSNIRSLPHPELRIEMPELMELRHQDDIVLWDTRRPAELCGEERSDNRRQGHIPDAVNLDWTCFLREADGPAAARHLYPPAELRHRAAAAGLVREKTIIPYCQSGVRAAFGYLVLHLVGYASLCLFDGSLLEWTNAARTPMGLDDRQVI
jgi:thiosulfate/3-mercaptopyruvate sulfurtransferase